MHTRPMTFELLNTIDKLNYLFHNGLNGGETERSLFNSFFTDLRSKGVMFSPARPEIVYGKIALTEYESKLYQKLQLVISEMKIANENKLTRYYCMMGDVQTSLIQELSILLMKRGVIEKKYFWKAPVSNIMPDSVTSLLNEIEPFLVDRELINVDFMGKPLQGTIAFIRPGRNSPDMYKWWDENGNYL